MKMKKEKMAFFWGKRDRLAFKAILFNPTKKAGFFSFRLFYVPLFPLHRGDLPSAPKQKRVILLLTFLPKRDRIALSPQKRLPQQDHALFAKTFLKNIDTDHFPSRPLG